jgi:DNA-directed RNA polymerase subunit H (RpoH/RPB5)
MHALQPVHTKLKNAEAEKLLNDLNISTSQLPKIKVNDPALSEDYKVGNIVKIERKDPESGKIIFYYRVVSV